MAEQITVLQNFESKEIFGTTRENAVAIAREVVNNLTLSEGTFFCIHNYSGRRLVYGYIYGNKTYGSVTYQTYEGWSVVVDINNGVYTARV